MFDPYTNSERLVRKRAALLTSMPRYCKAIVLALHIGTLAAITQGVRF